MKGSYFLKTALIILFGFLLAPVLSGQEEIQKKVLIIGIDGVRPDALLSADTKHMDALWQNGAYSFKAQTDEISSSGPCWTAMLTGVWHDKHNVMTNSYKNPNLADYPHFFRRIRSARPELKTYSVVNWGPMHNILQENDATYASSPKNDRRVTTKVARMLRSKDVDVMFVQLDHVDHAGHTHGYSPDSAKYLRAIEISDRQVGRMVDALKKRKDYAREDWLIIVSTDHGGSDYGHGKNIPEHTTIFYIASGESAARGEIEGPVKGSIRISPRSPIPVPLKWVCENPWMVLSL